MGGYSQSCRCFHTTVTACERTETPPVPRFAPYLLVALLALAGPTWMGFGGIAEAGYQPMGMDGRGMTTDLGGGADETADSPAIPTPDPDHRVQRDALHTPSPAGAGSTGSSASPGSGGPGLAAFSPAPPRNETFVARLWLAHVRVTLASHLSSVFEPPRPVASR